MKRRAHERTGPALGPRRAAANVLGRVYGQGAYADILLAEELDKVRAGDRGLVTELVYGVLRRSITVGWIIERFSKVKIKKMETAVQVALRLGVYQVYFLTRVPARAAVDESVCLVKGARKKGFVNAVLRRAAAEKENLTWPGPETDPAQRLSILYSHPQWLVRRWLRRYGEAEAVSLLKANLAAPPRTLRVNTLRTSREELLRKLSGLGISARPGRFSPLAVEIEHGPLPPALTEEGLAAPQDEASQLVPLLLSPRLGRRVLDACAAPGGKSAEMAALMENSGLVAAVDRYAGRLLSLKALARRLGIDIIRPVLADSTEPPFHADGAGAPFDAVLVDAPCSGLGVLGRTPDIKLHRKESDITALAGTQRRLLKEAIPLLRPGGALVYSVCTTEPEETEDIVSWVLENFDEMSLENAAKTLPPACAPLVTEEGFLKTMPHRHKMDGFFAARFLKKQRK